jgi:hypothetical protein
MNPRRPCSIVAPLVVAFVMSPWGLAAQSPAPGQGSAMPDPKAMSGLPLQVPDLPVGTVTVRVIRGALTNPLPGATVELTGPTPSRSEQTDAAGRATFSAVPPGTAVKAVVVVNGERIESRDFQVPAAGGTRLMLVATDAAIEQQAAEDRKLAQAPPVTGVVVFGEQSRFVLEVGDDALNVFYILQIVNTAKRPVDVGGPLVFDLPPAAVGAGMLEGSAKNGVAAGKKVTITGPFAPGDTMIQFAYSVPLGSEEIVLAQRVPAQMTQVSVIAQKIGAMQLSSPQVKDRREMAAEGQTYIVGHGGPVKAGDTVTLTLSGLPHRATWPRNVALLLALGVLGAGAWGATRGASPQQASRRQQMHTRRDQLFADLAALEEQRRKGSVDARVYATRREQLVTALEDLYAGLEREVA